MLSMLPTSEPACSPLLLCFFSTFPEVCAKCHRRSKESAEVFSKVKASGWLPERLDLQKEAILT